MARRVITETYCDPCLADGTDREAVYSGSIRIDNTTKTLELCDQHLRQLVTPLEEALHKYGTREAARGTVTPIYRGRGKGGTKAGQGYECTESGCEEGPFRAPQGLSAHLRLRHGISAADRKKAVNA